mmetsp:Transcript_70936/g.117870  ORF Transcript_70936/g.117870 Transcript_70936/m.117870 type:complete len:228 (+) Transcript_70936:1193-1876(+)
MACDRMGLLLAAAQNETKCRDVLVVPRIPICDGRAVSDAGDLVTIIPPRHHAGIFWCVVTQPPIGLAVVVDHDLLPIIKLCLKHDLRLGHTIRQLVRVIVELNGLGIELKKSINAEANAQHEHDSVVVQQVEPVPKNGSERLDMLKCLCSGHLLALLFLFLFFLLLTALLLVIGILLFVSFLLLAALLLVIRILLFVLFLLCLPLLCVRLFEEADDPTEQDAKLLDR